MSRPFQRRHRPGDPQTPEEWQEAVDLAAGARLIADCKMYGVITGGPAIDVARCDFILRRGAKLGIRPSRPPLDTPNIQIEITDASEFHCFKLTLNPRWEECQNCDGHGTLMRPSAVHEEPPVEYDCDVCHGEGKLTIPGSGIEIMLHARSLVDLIHKCNLALCDWQKATTDDLLQKLVTYLPPRGNE